MSDVTQTTAGKGEGSTPAPAPVLEQVVHLLVTLVSSTSKDKPKQPDTADLTPKPEEQRPTTPSGKAKTKAATAPKATSKKEASKDATPPAPVPPPPILLKLSLWDGGEPVRSDVLQWQVLEETAEAISYQVKSEVHAKLVVNASSIRAMAAAQGLLKLSVQIVEGGIPAAAAKPASGQPPPELEGPEAVLALDCCGFLLGETQAAVSWPEHPVKKAAELELLQTCQLSAQVLSLPSQMMFPAKAPATPPPAAGKKAAAKSAAAEPNLADIPGEPVVLMPRDLAVRLNPIVVRPLAALSLPAAPATQRQLDTACHPVKMRVSWPAGQAFQDQPGAGGSWASSGSGLAVRDASFHGHAVFLAGDDPAASLASCQHCPMLVEVHDRDALLDPPLFYLPQGESQDADDPGYVCARSTVSLKPLALGAARMQFEVPLQPFTTVRGAGSLDWKSRPGNYMEAQSVLRGEVLLACPLQETLQLLPSSTELPFSRAMFLFDYRDSELLHVLEDLLRLHNAKCLGLNKRKESLLANRFPGTDQAADHKSAAGTADDGAQEGSDGDRMMRSQPSFAGSQASHAQGATPKGKLGRADSRASPERSTSLARLASRKVPAASASAAEEGDVAGAASSGGSFSQNGHAGAAGSAKPIPPASLHVDVDEDETPAGSLAERVKARAGTPPLPDHEHVRFKKSCKKSGSSDEEEEEDPPTEADLKLQQLQANYKDVELDVQLLQSLATYQANEEQCSGGGLDLLTGLQLVDGAERMILLEGLADGVMTIVQGVADWALAEQRPLPGMRVRQVLLNNDHRHSSRLFADFGMDLWIVKLRSKLPKIVADAGTYAAGQVRPDCIEGVRRLGQLRNTSWARQAADMQLWPASAMINLVDKKFGGELTKGDVFGVEAEEEEDSEDGGPEAHGPFSVFRNDDARSSRSAASSRSRSLGRSLSRSSSKRSTGSRRSAGSRSKKAKKRSRLHRSLPLDMDNEAYVHLRNELHAQRLERNFMRENIDALAAVEAASAGLRETWKSWNPHAEATERLHELVATGQLTAQQTLQREPHTSQEPGAVTREVALARGWCPHTKTFKWPAPCEPAEFKAHPHKPSQFRIEDLQSPWEEGTNFRPLLLRGAVPGAAPFITAIRGEPNGLFGTDTEYWKTVHLGGVGWERERQEHKQQEIDAWKSKVVVDDVAFHATGAQRAKPSQTDRLHSMLWHEPQKKSLKDTYVPPAPVSMHLAEPYKETPVGGIARDGGGVDSFTARGVDFNRNIPRDKTSLHKPGLDQSWTAAMHDFET